MTVIERLAQLFPAAKKTTLKQMLQTGRVRLGSETGPAVRRTTETLAEGVDLFVLSRAPEPPRHRKGELSIVFEDDHILIIDKPPGMLTATVPHEPRPTLAAKVTEYLARTAPRARMGLIHRLDKDARGLLVFSKTEIAYGSLKGQLKSRAMSRQYHAVTHGIPKPAMGKFENYLIENEVEGKVNSTTNTRKGELAITHYETVGTYRFVKGQPEKALLKVTLETGRKHQIRVHLSEAGYPIMGDPIYNIPPFNKPPLLLAATNLAFHHPYTGKPVAFEIPVPDSLKDAVTRPPVAPPNPPAAKAEKPAAKAEKPAAVKVAKPAAAPATSASAKTPSPAKAAPQKSPATEPPKRRFPALRPPSSRPSK